LPAATFKTTQLVEKGAIAVPADKRREIGSGTKATGQ
jgi:hypothetical protein